MNPILPNTVRALSADMVRDTARYAQARKAIQATVQEYKRARRVHVGPHATFLFENATTMFYQVNEMLFIEKGGEAQIAEELEAYNALIPQGNELVATMMIEIPDAEVRKRLLLTYGHIEAEVSIEVGGESIVGVPEEDTERTTAAGKTSSVHFLHFPFTDSARAKLVAAGAEVSLAVNHENYAHSARLSASTLETLIGDLH